MKASIRKVYWRRWKAGQRTRKGHRFLDPAVALLASLSSSKRYCDLFVLPAMRWISFLIDAAQEDGKQVVIPKTYPKGRMGICSTWSAELNQQPRSWNQRMEPRRRISLKIDLIHVPGSGCADGLIGQVKWGGWFTDCHLADSWRANCQHHLCLLEADFAPAPMIFQYRRFCGWINYLIRNTRWPVATSH